ncbi:MAG: tRNA lysidine(34) synthetase TilS [Lactobacillales bacterium]|jgi:tRNA(Ile)-lysidine synthase|nr:tRNA lysidine(34) synthetase TilS [Lactobacillales bacterium]
MKKRFLEHLQKTKLLLFREKILLAVSGGVDSIVLLSLLVELQKMFQWEIAVVHVNHKLRLESAKEALFVKKMANDFQLAYFEKSWLKGLGQKVAVEKKARVFRYNYFASLMQEFGFTSLVTAHHGDDQIETQIMKWIRGNFLGSLKGILQVQAFANGRLVRPLLPFAKKDLYQEAKRRQLSYYEDASNQDEKYFRNRIRKQILPVVKKENPKAVVCANRFSKQVSFFEELLKESFAEWFNENDILDLDAFLLLSEAKQYLYLMIYFTQMKIILTDAKLEMILEVLFDNAKPNWKFQISDDFCFVKAYKKAYVTNCLKEADDTKYVLSLNESVWLSENQWLGFGVNYCKSDGYVVERYHTPLAKIVARHPKLGDRLALTPTFSKKIARLFIDEKVPAIKRSKQWLVEDKRGILFIPEFKYSYLSQDVGDDKMTNEIVYVNTNSENMHV